MPQNIIPSPPLAPLTSVSPGYGVDYLVQQTAVSLLTLLDDCS